MPKTGGTFVTECFESINQRRSKSYIFFRRLRGEKHDFFMEVPGQSKHARVANIPKSLRRLPVIGCIRNPLEWYRSNYCFAWWLRYPERYPGVLDSSDFPNLTFTKYLELSNAQWLENDLSDISTPPNAGRYTILLAKWFSPDPTSFFRRCGGTISGDNLIAEIGDIHWLQVHRLNEDLHALLVEFGYPEKEVRFILEASPKLPYRDPRIETLEAKPMACNIDNYCRSIIESKDAAAFELIRYIEAKVRGEV